MRVKFGDILTHLSGDKFVVGSYNGEYNTMPKNVTLVNITPSRVGGLRAKVLTFNQVFDIPEFFDIKTDFNVDPDFNKVERFNGEAYVEVPTDDLPELEDGDLFVGTCPDNDSIAHVFKIHFPNKVQRLHDNEWATIGTAGQYNFDEMSTSEIFKEISYYSKRFGCYSYSVPNDLNKY